ncbi:MAG: hypothetical protein RLY97_2037 [Pseudomonadota bacterium]
MSKIITTNRPRRSALYMPASNAKAISKARTLAADIIILDLEDSVAPENKHAARAAAIAAVTEGGFGNREIAIRANGLDTEWGADDLAAIAASPAHAVLVPKVSTASDITIYNAALAHARPQMQLWAMIETCQSINNLSAIAAMSATTRLSLWIMGLNDLAKEMRAKSTPDRAAFQSILSLAICAARANNLTILDSVCNEFRDLGLFTQECQQGQIFGFDGKSLIHPDQITPCNAVFSPNPEELAHAAAIIAAFALPENSGKGVIRVDGKMTELLHRDQAQQLLDLAAQIAAN